MTAEAALFRKPKFPPQDPAVQSTIPNQHLKQNQRRKHPVKIDQSEIGNGPVNNDKIKRGKMEKVLNGHTKLSVMQELRMYI